MPSTAATTSIDELTANGTVPSVLQSGLANQQLHDVLITEVLPKLPLGVLGSLRGTCSSLRDLLDSQHSSQSWSGAVGHRLHNQLKEYCRPCAHAANDDSSGRRHGSEPKGCSLCMQGQLRHVARSSQRLTGSSRILRWSRHPMFMLCTRSLHWSPCSR